MIIVRREFIWKWGMPKEAKAVTKEYKALFDQANTWRIYSPTSGDITRIIIDESYESLAEYEAQWAARTATPEFQTWVEKWSSVTADNGYAVSFWEAIE